MFCYLWEFIVAPGSDEAFVAAYGPDGAWVRLFRRDPAYVRTELWRDADDPGRLVTMDCWRSRVAFQAFRAREAQAFADLDAACESFTESERHLGDFETVDG